LYSVISAAVFVTFATRPGVITEAFVSRFADKVSVTFQEMSGYIHIAITVVCVLAVIGALAEIGTTISKTVRNYK
jgi:hypothetical protein